MRTVRAQRRMQLGPARAVRDTRGVNISDLARRILERTDDPQRPLPIVQAGHPALRRRAQDALAPDAGAHPSLDDLRIDPAILGQLARRMTLTMRDAPGVGLAAPQIGLPLRMTVIEDPFAAEPGEDPDDDLHERTPVPLRALLDPVYEVIGAERVFAYEGCLSVDGWQSIVPRARRVRLRAVELDADGSVRRIDEELVGWPARIVQHETDHLDGTLCHDLGVPRSFVQARWAARYDIHEAIDRLGLTGEITAIPDGDVVLPAR